MPQLNYHERKTIEQLILDQKTYREIGKIVGRNHSVIAREVKRNSGSYLPYSADKAQLRAEKRLLGKRPKQLVQDETLKTYVIAKLKLGWSPEQIAGRLRQESSSGRVSHETIYRFVYSTEGREMKLSRYLRTFRPRRYLRGSRRSHENRIPERIGIQLRPSEVTAKKRYGDWETDTVTSGHSGKGGVSVQYERKSQLCRIHKLISKRAEETLEAITKTIDSLPLWLFLTFTFDNGTENVKHADLRRQFGVGTYFCDPYRSWQKGGVENLNKLIRQYFPKKTDFAKVSEEEILIVQEKLNDRPRKSLGFKTPNEVISKLTGGAFDT